MFGLRRLVAPVLRLAAQLYRNDRLRYYAVEILGELDPFVPVPGVPRLSLRVTSHMEHQRLIGFLDKEPETIAWLNHLQPGDLFLDIGANIGVYSLYAAAIWKTRVIAFEPESQNFAALNANIQRNGLSDLIAAYPLAASDVTGPTDLHLGSFGTGHSLHFLPGTSIGGKPCGHVQGVYAVRLDDFFVGRPAPRFVKIDVDGAENLILAGMPRLLSEIESLLIELPADTKPSVAGMRCRHRPERTTGFGNFIFER